MLPIFKTKSLTQFTDFGNKWKLKEQSENIKNNKEELTPDEKQLRDLMRQADSIREGKKTTELVNKMKSGAKLTQEERAYLLEKAPDEIKDYEEVKRKKETYEAELKRCKTKEDAEKVKLNHMGFLMAQARDISTDPYIPKEKKMKMLEKLMKETVEIEESHTEFVKSEYYKRLPDKPQYKNSEEVQIADENSDLDKEENINSDSEINKFKEAEFKEVNVDNLESPNNIYELKDIKLKLEEMINAVASSVDIQISMDTDKKEKENMFDALV